MAVATKTKRPPTSAKIITFVVKNGQVSAGEIAKHLKRDPQGLSGTLSQLVQKGRIVRLERGIYGAAKAGLVPAPSGKKVGKAAAELAAEPTESVTRQYNRKRSADQRIADALTALYPEGMEKGQNPLLLIQWLDITKELING